MKSRNWTPITLFKARLDKENKKTTATRLLHASNTLRKAYQEDEALSVFCALDGEDWVMMTKKEGRDGKN